LTASTGIAALHIGGGTLHLKFQLTEKENGQFYSAASRNQKLRVINHNLIAIIIDEISIINFGYLDHLDSKLRQIRCEKMKELDQLPSGGIFILMLGDLYQIHVVQHKTTHFKETGSRFVHMGDHKFMESYELKTI
jgi:hypothetical protein